MSRYTEKDAAKETGVPIKEAKRTYHGARDDAASCGMLEERNINKISDSKNGPVLYNIFKEIKDLEEKKKEKNK